MPILAGSWSGMKDRSPTEDVWESRLSELAVLKMFIWASGRSSASGVVSQERQRDPRQRAEMDDDDAMDGIEAPETRDESEIGAEGAAEHAHEAGSASDGDDDDVPPPPPPGPPPTRLPPAPLKPPVWNELKAEDGRTYWFNPDTKVATFERPPGLPGDNVPPPPSGPPPGKKKRNRARKKEERSKERVMGL